MFYDLEYNASKATIALKSLCDSVYNNYNFCNQL